MECSPYKGHMVRIQDSPSIERRYTTYQVVLNPGEHFFWEGGVVDFLVRGKAVRVRHIGKELRLRSVEDKEPW